MLFIPFTKLTDKTRERATVLGLPVTIVGSLAYTVPSATRPGEIHEVEFDDAFAPNGFRCSCEAAHKGIGCHAVAASLTRHVERARELIRRESRVSFITAAEVAPDIHLNAALDRLTEITRLARFDELGVTDTSRVAFLTHQAIEEIRRAREGRLMNAMAFPAEKEVAA